MLDRLHGRMLVLAIVVIAGCASTTEDEPEPVEDSETASALEEAPIELAHSNNDTPLPRWEDAVRVWEGPSSTVHTSVVRMLGGDEKHARATFEGWTETIRRGFVILIDKITNEGWLEGIDHLVRDPWDSAFHFWPRATALGSLSQVLEMKARSGVYIENTLANGGFAYFNKWNHKEWVRAWAETDAPHAGLHIGIFADGRFEVHMELYNPMFINAPLTDLFWLPGLGWINRPLFFMHQHWEAGAQGKNRTSANYWHFLHNDGFPLSF